MLTNLVHFHFRGARASTVQIAKFGWAQGAFYGPYYGAGVGATTVNETATYGWAQGAWYGPFYGPGTTVIAPTGRSQYWRREFEREAERERLILQEDEEILEIVSILVHRGIL